LKARFRPPGPPPFPEDNPFTAQKLELGRQLFFEPLLSGSRTHSCASCHNPGLSWGDGLPLAVGDRGEKLALRAPTLIDVAWLSILGWDGKFPGLEEVTFIPILGRGNMDLDEETAKARIAAVPAYVDEFAAAFGDGAVTRARIENAIATYERTLVSSPAPFDKWIDGDESAIGDAAKRGFVVFNGPGNCAACHSGWAFTDGSFHDIGSATGDDVGRGRLFPTSLKLRYAFKVPTLRDVARRAPFMHDGAIASLESVIDLYDRGGIDRPSRSPEIKPLHLSDQQKSDLVAFLQTLTSPPEPVPVPVLPR
jgi:cytochrome c peroxidase